LNHLKASKIDIYSFFASTHKQCVTASSSPRTPAFLHIAALAVLLSACATDPKEINGHKVTGSHVVNGRKVYELESGKSDEQSMADTLAQMKADTDSMVLPPATPAPSQAEPKPDQDSPPAPRSENKTAQDSATERQ
jgi:hypothetical protein